jgi:hypothetical protein
VLAASTSGSGGWLHLVFFPTLHPPADPCAAQDELFAIKDEEARVNRLVELNVMEQVSVCVGWCVWGGGASRHPVTSREHTPCQVSK